MFKIEKSKMSDFIITRKKESCKQNPRYTWIHLHLRGISGESSITGYIDSSFERKYVYGIHQEKHRKTVKQTKIKGKNGHKVVEKAYWIVTVYKFSIERVKFLKQHSRHFDVVLF